MQERIWNSFEFADWSLNELTILANGYDEDAIEIDIEGPEQNCYAWFTPQEARAIAAKLIEAADTIEAAGRVNQQNRSET